MAKSSRLRFIADRFYFSPLLRFTPLDDPIANLLRFFGSILLQRSLSEFVN